MSLNTAPRTWVASEVVTAAMMNTEVRDAFTGIQAVWTTYTPTITGWTQGNGTVAGRYMQIGKTIKVRIKFTFGSTSVASGSINFSDPVAAASDYVTHDTVGGCHLFDTSAAAHQHGLTIMVGTGAFSVLTNADALLGATVPWTWATGDTIFLQAAYEAA